MQSWQWQYNGNHAWAIIECPGWQHLCTEGNEMTLEVWKVVAAKTIHSADELTRGLIWGMQKNNQLIKNIC